MIPYNEKLWGVHPREITAAWCSRFVPLPKLEQVIAGAVGAGPPELGYNQSFLYPKRAGSRPSPARCRRGWGAPARRARPYRLGSRRRSTGAGASSRVGGDGSPTAPWWRRCRSPSCSSGCATCRPRSRPRRRASAARRSRYLNVATRRPAARRLALDLRARTAVSVLSRERLLVRGGQHGPRGQRLDLRRAGRPRAHLRTATIRDTTAALVAAGALRRRGRRRVRRAQAASTTRTSSSTTTTTRRRTTISPFSRRTRSIRAAATAPGPTTRWRTACSPGARWRR